MKKLFFIMVTLVAVLIFTSASTKTNGGSLEGTTATNFTIGNDDGVVNLTQFRGQYVLLSLWSSADIVSRLDNIRCDRYAAQSSAIKLMSVNFDRSRALFDQLVANDSLNASSQYFCDKQDRSVFEQHWGTTQQLNTYLINPKGVVVAVNPSNQELAAMVK